VSAFADTLRSAKGHGPRGLAPRADHRPQAQKG